MNKAVKKIAKFRSSFAFVAFLSIFVAIWITLNTWPYTHHFDTYPFIFLTLLLSIEASLMMPIMMMASAAQANKLMSTLAEDLKLDKKTQKEIQEIMKKLDTLIGVVDGHSN